jgi:predicted O-linked N-acetylglucosamine transferase (SPINDLY family)
MSHAPQRSSPQDVLREGLQHHTAGRLEQAASLYRQVPTGDVRFPESLDLLGVIALQAGRPDAAVDYFSRAIAEKDDEANYHCHMGLALKGQGKLDEALLAFDRALQLEPAFAEAHNSRAVLLQALGRLDQAVAAFDAALAAKPDLVEAHYNKGVALKELGKPEEALATYEKALALNPGFFKAHNNRGVVLASLGKLDEAIASYDRAIVLKPDYAEAHNNRGNALRALRRLDEAIASYHRALAGNPTFLAALTNLSVVMTEQGALGESVAVFDRLLALQPDHAEALTARGTALNNLRRLEEAVESFDRAVACRPDLAGAHFNRGIALCGLGRFGEAVASFEAALALEPALFDYAGMAKLALPVILPAAFGIAPHRERYRASIATLMAFEGPSRPVDSFTLPAFFHLAYHDSDDREAMEALRALYRTRLPELVHAAPHVATWQPPAAGRRIRIGFLSEFFREHTIERLNRGLVRALDRARFEVVVIHASTSRASNVPVELDELADRSVRLEPSLVRQRESIAGEHLDILFYPDIGMSRETYFLAHARLAPVQAVGWGHPTTTGLDTLDYFVSAAGAEPPGADRQYTERLIGLGRLPCFYARPAVRPGVTRAEFGLPESGTLYGCPQSLFKFHPEFDALLAAIAEGDPQGHIVLVEGQYPSWGDLLRQRWAATHPVLVERVRFVPRLSADRFIALMAHFDVLLDPIHFGSGNTLYESMTHGTPIVTWPGRFMRGRIVAAAYRQMGVADAPIAKKLEDYAQLALALGRDPDRREKLRRTSRVAAAEGLFEDRQAVREFEAFVIAAVEAASRNEKLPPGWRPGTHLPAAS